MNVLFILSDSVNRNHLSCYGNDWVQTPNLQRLANRGVVFDNHFVGSVACMPARRDVWTGRKEFLWRGWGQIEPFDDHIAKRANALGAYTGISTDHPHYCDRSHGYGYIEWFEDRSMIRGQEGDRPIAPAVREEDLPVWVQSAARVWPLEACIRYYRGVMQFREEEDWPTAGVMHDAAQALETGADCGSFMVFAEAFSPHEPWWNPEPYRSMYGPARDDLTCFPPYEWMDSAKAFFEGNSGEEIEYLRQQYAGSLTMMDHHLGRLLDVMDRRNLWDDTVVIFTTDHGHELGERGRYGKSYPHWNSHANIPLIICHPEANGPRRVDAYSTAVDLNATMLDVLGDLEYRCPHGRSLLPVVRGERQGVRDGVLYGTFGHGACWVDDEVTFFSGFDNEKQPSYWYGTNIERSRPASDAEADRFMPDVDMPVWRYRRDYGFTQPQQMQPQLFAREDVDQQNDRAGDKKLLSRTREKIRAAIEEETAPPEAFRRLLLNTA